MTDQNSPSANSVAHDFGFFRIHTDGRVVRVHDPPSLPPSTAPTAAVLSKDVLISSDPKVSARLYIPNPATENRKLDKLPLLFYVHGGAFSLESAFSTTYHPYLNELVETAGVVAVSVEYRLAPENPIPACYDDAWEALKWVNRHARPDSESGISSSAAGSDYEKLDSGLREFVPDPWLKDYADFGRIFLAGDSAGANIAHTMAIRAGSDPLGSGVKITGFALIHPFFGNGKPDKLWGYICPDSGADDPRLDPAANPGLFERMACRNVLVCTAGKDFLRDRGWRYYESLKKSDWGGEVKIFEIEGEEHVFHLINPGSEKARRLMEVVKSFLNEKPLKPLL